jgi:hypothetical protein
VEHGQYGVSVDQVRVRHVSRYRNGKDGAAMLKITMWQSADLEWDAADDGSQGTRVMRAERSDHDGTMGLADTWYEASLSSAVAERAFAENAGMEFGDQTAWTEGALRDEGVWKGLLRPAVAMVERMDGIGSGDDNGHGHEVSGDAAVEVCNGDDYW